MEHLNEILFIDIETVPLLPDFALLSQGMQDHWKKKSKQLKVPVEEEANYELLFSERAGVFSEFAKVVCIGVGSLVAYDGGWNMRLKSLVDTDERKLLYNFNDLINKFCTKFKNFNFCGHNIKEFDIPFLCRRMVINNVVLPESMQLSGKKPWEVNMLDTMDLWKFGDFKHYTTLALLAEILGIPSPKSDLDGSMVASVFWKENDLDRIGSYCLQDVLTTAKIYLKLKGIYDIEINPVYIND